MNKITKYLRWLGCVPAGLIGGTLLAAAGIALVDGVVGISGVAGPVGGLVCGVVQPIAVYRLGMRIAPDRGELSRRLMLLANWLLIFLAAIDLTRLALGLPVPGTDGFTWWTILACSLGSMLGCFRVFQEEDAETLAGKAQAERFDWDRPSQASSPTR